MFKLEQVSPTVRTRIKNAKIPMNVLGRELQELDNKVAIEQIQLWIDSVLSGKVIKAAGEPLCGKGLLLQGKPGVGKTTLACAALQQVLLAGQFKNLQPGLFIDYPKFLRLQQSTWGEDKDQEVVDLIARILGDTSNSIELLILDDLGKEYRTKSAWAETTFDALLRSRFNAGLPTIVTTNVPLREWSAVYGEPMGSFAYEAFISVGVQSDKGDYRKL